MLQMMQHLCAGLIKSEMANQGLKFSSSRFINKYTLLGRLGEKVK